MPDFIYEGKAKGGKAVRGEYTAQSRDDVFRYLRGRGIAVTSVKRKPRPLSLSMGTGVKQEDITGFARQFAAMISAGLPLIQCLNILTEQSENKNFKKVLISINLFPVKRYRQAYMVFESDITGKKVPEGNIFPSRV